MDFFIQKNSTLPILEYDVTDVSDKYNITDDMWNNCAVTFSMIDENGIYRIANREALLIITEKIIASTEPYKYKIAYKFSERDTRKSGQYQGELTVDFLGDDTCGKIKFPIGGKFNIYIADSISKTTVQ